MGKILVVAEKPQAGKDIAKILGVTEQKKGYMESDQYIVTWAIGHLIGLKQPDEVDERYKKWSLEDIPLPTDNGLKVQRETFSQFKVIKELIQRSDVERLINAGDAGREGLLIQSWIYRMAGNRHPVDILWASSLTDEAIRNAMNHLHSSNEAEFVNLLREAETRAESDLKYGFNYSRILTLLYAKPGTVLSYGRCQTPLLNLIFKRDMQNENFKSEPYWTIEATYVKGFKGTLVVGENKIKKFSQEATAKDVCNECFHKSGIVSRYSTEDKNNKAPALFNLSELQGIMGKKYGFTPDKTLQIAQSLYETHKIMSYPRTDSRYLSNDLFHEIAKHIQCCSFGKFRPFVEKIDFSAITLDKSYFNDNKVSDHHALIPTMNVGIEAIYQKLSQDEQRCFDEIVVSLLSIFLPKYEYQVTDIDIMINGNSFHSTGTTIRKLGYREVYQLLEGKEKQNDQELQILPQLQEGVEIKVDTVDIKEGKTKPPARYSPGNIVKLMNKYKIGTSATAAEIIKTLEKRGFITLEKNKYCTTELGRNFINIVPEELKLPELTMNFEENLQKVNSGELSKEEFLKSIDRQIVIHLEKFKQTAPEKKLGMGNKQALKCPLCGSELRMGKTKSGKENVYCTGYKNDPHCEFKIWREIAGKTLTEAQIIKLVHDGKSPLIKGFTAKSGNKFDAYLVLGDGGKVEFIFPERKHK